MYLVTFPQVHVVQETAHRLKRLLLWWPENVCVVGQVCRTRPALSASKLRVRAVNQRGLVTGEDVGLKMETVKFSSLIPLTFVKVCVCSANWAELFNLSVLRMMFEQLICGGHFPRREERQSCWSSEKINHIVRQKKKLNVAHVASEKWHKHNQSGQQTKCKEILQ